MIKNVFSAYRVASEDDFFRELSQNKLANKSLFYENSKKLGLGIYKLNDTLFDKIEKSFLEKVIAYNEKEDADLIPSLRKEFVNLILNENNLEDRKINDILSKFKCLFLGMAKFSDI